MAARHPRGRKAPKRKHGRYKIRGKWITVEYFRGYELRHTQPDLDIFFWNGDGSLIGESVKRNTLWLDVAYRAEEAFMVRVYEIQTMRKWSKSGDNKRCPPYQHQREELKQKLCLPGPVPDFVVSKTHDEARQLDIWHVRGDIIRQYHDPHFVFGGHDLVYAYVPKRTVFIDVCQDEREIPYSLHHEIVERELMEKGWTYNRAHARAIRAELTVRLEEYRLKNPPTPKPEPLPLVAIGQETDAGCGPTSEKMLLDFDDVLDPDTGKPFTEEKLIVLSECDPELGTDHAPLVKATQKIVGDAFTHGESGTIRMLRRVVLKERRPVMVGWWSGPHHTSEEVRADPELDEGHYCVVKHITRTHVILADPWIIDDDSEEGGAPGDNKIPIKEFLERWYDMDGTPTPTDPGFHIVRGWFLFLHAKPLKPKSD
ncbi:MAG: hypothetical protein WC866_01455 [Patescibacteria group bacterium]|jgi:hypothetical protein